MNEKLAMTEGGTTCVVDNPEHIAPLLVDSSRGAEILGIGLPNFHKFVRKNPNAPAVMVGSLQRWRRKDLLRFTGRPCGPRSADDILIDARTLAALCSISRSLAFKLNERQMLPEPIQDGRTLRWSFQAIGEWVDKGCPPRRKAFRRR